MSPSQIVLIHGLTGSKRLFAGLEGRLRRPPTSADTLSFDLPGFGENKDVESRYDVGDQLNFITGTIERRFPSGPLALVGHSLGGVLALAWAVHHRDRVSWIVLINTPLGENRDDIRRQLLHDRFGWGAVLLNHRRMAHLACVVLRGAQVIRAFYFAKPAYVPDEVFDDYTAHRWRAIAETFDRVLLGVPGAALVRAIGNVPILNLTGCGDAELSRRAIIQPNVHNAMLPGGHLMLLEHPDSTAEAIARFLNDGASRNVIYPGGTHIEGRSHDDD
ncbi:MAG: alpha/beta hydrolase [Acidobacteria bacterium]|nr:alpha/beta hydrolase [Acidobacteriota bacterium]